MADDLSSFIESQKRKLEQERTEMLRAQETEDRSRTSPRGYKPDNRHTQGGPTPASESRIKAKATVDYDSNVGGLSLGGYEKHQQKLRQERKEEYRKYLAEKNFRSTGKADPVLSDNSRSPYPGYKPGEAQGRRDENDDGDDSFQGRRRGKENYDDSAKDYDSRDRRGTRKPENLFESYEELLQRKRAQEKRYRGFDDSDFGADRPMRLNAPQYKQQSRSDGYLSRKYDDDDYDESFSRNRPRGRRERNFEPKRVRFHGDEDLDDDTWVKPRRKLDFHDDEEEDEEELLEWVRKRGKRPQRRNSAHLPDREPPQEESLQRSKTDSNIRSQSAPLEGAGVIGGSQESRIAKAKKQEQYKKELQQQMQEQADIRKREKLLHLGVEQNGGWPPNPELDRTPPDVIRGSRPPQSQGYDMSLANHGPSSRPPPHPAIHSNPYDDPYYYYGALEMGASVGGPMNAPRGTGQSGVAGLRLDAEVSGDAPLQSRDTNISRNQGYSTPAPAVFSQQGGGDLSPRSGMQPPGGYSSLGADPGSADKKKAAQHAYQEELKRQMQERDAKKRKEKEEKERYDRKIEQEAANYNPWGKGGGGAPLRDSTGHLVANLRTLKQYNDQGINVSPRDQPPPVETRFEMTTTSEPYLSPRQEAGNLQTSPMQAAELSGSANRATFGRSDPLKEAQPQDDLKRAARQEYQEYLRKQVEEKEKKKKEEIERIKREEEELEKRIAEERLKMQKDFEEEQEKSRRKEEEARLKNEQIKEAQEAKKREAEKKKKDMEEQRQAELKRKLDAELAAKKAASQGSSAQARTSSPPIPTVQKKMEEAGHDMTDFRSLSPPIPTIANKQTSQGPVAAASPVPPVHPVREPEPVRGGTADKDVLSQLTALRQQLKNEEKRVQQQMDHSTAVTNYSEMQRAPEDLGSRRGRRDVHVFERALANKTAVVKKDTDEGFSAADEFNRMKYEETSSLAGEFRSKFPHPVSTSSVLDLQQQAFLMEQEDKLAALRSDANRHNKQAARGGGQPYQVSRRPLSRDSLLESESQFLVVDDPKQMLPIEQMSSRPRQSSARERRRWKQLEEMARNPRPHDTYKPPTPGGFSLNSVTSFNVDEVANRNEERLRRLELIQRGGGQGGRGSLQGNPDQVLQRFMDERSRPANLASRLSEASLEAETSFEPV